MHIYVYIYIYVDLLNEWIVSQTFNRKMLSLTTGVEYKLSEDPYIKRCN